MGLKYTGQIHIGLCRNSSSGTILVPVGAIIFLHLCSWKDVLILEPHQDQNKQYLPQARVYFGGNEGRPQRHAFNRSVNCFIA